jgi:hypothetical protein
VLTIDDAREVLDLDDIAQVADLVRAGALRALLTKDADFGLMFHPDELAAYDAERQRGQAGVPEVSTAVRAQGIIRAYLAARPPLDGYNQAVLQQRPLRVAVKGRSVLGVQVAALLEFHNRSDAVQLQQAAPITSGSLTAALERIDAVRMRGFIAEADRGTSVQRWAWWWRLPDSLVEGTVPLPGVMVHEGERAKVTGGHPHLTTSLTSHDSDG